jgi:hypothetical protein
MSGGMYHFVIIIVFIRYETTAAACWALLLIVRTFFNDAITVAVWTGFHVRLLRTPVRSPSPRDAPRAIQLCDVGAVRYDVRYQRKANINLTATMSANNPNRTSARVCAF